MIKTLNRIKSIKIPSHIKKKIGIDDNWLNKISAKEKILAFHLSVQFKETLKKLSKN